MKSSFLKIRHMYFSEHKGKTRKMILTHGTNLRVSEDN